MATAEEIAALRLLIAEPDADTYSDEDLSARLAGVGASQYTVASDIWTEKAAAAAQLVDMSEGGSSRKLGDIYEQALSMASAMHNRATANNAPPDGAVTRVKRLTRP